MSFFVVFLRVFWRRRITRKPAFSSKSVIGGNFVFRKMALATPNTIFLFRRDEKPETRLFFNFKKQQKQTFWSLFVFLASEREISIESEKKKSRQRDLTPREINTFWQRSNFTFWQRVMFPFDNKGWRINTANRTEKAGVNFD